MEFVVENTLGMVNDEEILTIKDKIEAAHDTLHKKVKTNDSGELVGWLELPSRCRVEVERIKKAAQIIRGTCDVFIVVGVGGSYLGSRAMIEFLKLPLHNFTNKPHIFYAGNNFSSNTIGEILKIIDNKEVIINIISKSGCGLEPMLTFGILLKHMKQKYGEKEAKKRIVITTAATSGPLRELGQKEGFLIFDLPKNIGGRYSVLTAAGLLPAAVAGVDIEKVVKGAEDAQIEFSNCDISRNICYKYAAARSILYKKGKHIELLVNYDDGFGMFTEWWRQLFAESEGKNETGLFPVGANFSADLHSIGQYIQDGEKLLFETIISISEPINDIEVDMKGFGEFEFLNGRKLTDINRQVMLGTVQAHSEGRVPILIISIEKQDEYNIGYLLYFFMKACAISGYMSGINPFDQPGVEQYKQYSYNRLK